MRYNLLCAYYYAQSAYNGDVEREDTDDEEGEVEGHEGHECHEEVMSAPVGVVPVQVGRQATDRDDIKGQWDCCHLDRVHSASSSVDGNHAGSRG